MWSARKLAGTCVVGDRRGSELFQGYTSPHHAARFMTTCMGDLGSLLGAKAQPRASIAWVMVQQTSTRTPGRIRSASATCSNTSDRCNCFSAHRRNSPVPDTVPSSVRTKFAEVWVQWQRWGVGSVYVRP